jgi:hypothetical protein
MNQNAPFTLFPNTSPFADASGYGPSLHDLISKRAYELFEKHGRRKDHELENWLEAEREIKHHFGL